MMFEATCGQPGCGYVSRAPGLAECAAWLWHHHAVAHRGLRDLEDCQKAAVMVDDGEPLGYPGTPSARQYVPEKRPAA